MPSVLTDFGARFGKSKCGEDGDGEKEYSKRTSWNLPNAAFADGELRGSNGNLHLAFCDEESHVHFPGVFLRLEPTDRHLHKPSTKEFLTDNFAILKICAMYLSQRD
jgi:hypothetical protein